MSHHKSPGPIPGEEPLFQVEPNTEHGYLGTQRFVIGTDPTNQAGTPAADPEHAISMSITTRAELLKKALGYVAGISMREGLVKANRIPEIRQTMVKRYQGAHNADGMVEGANFNLTEDQKRLEQIFPLLFGAQLMIDNGRRTPEDSHEEVSKYLSDFVDTYSGAEGASARKDASFLATRSAGIISRNMRANKLRKHREPQEELILSMSFLNDPSEAEAEYPVAEPLIKLRALRDDPRAGFMPGEYNENNEGSVLLDYISDTVGDPKDLGVHEHLIEIHDHQAKFLYARKRELKAKLHITPEEVAEFKSLSKHHIEAVALAAQKSVGVSYFDFYNNAKQQGAALQVLDEALAGQSRSITIAEALEDIQDPAVLNACAAACASLVQFVDVRRYCDREIKPSTYDQLHTVEEDRGSQAHPEKNKTITDVYNARIKDKLVTERIEQYVKTQKLGDIYKVLADAKLNQARRTAFWDGVLNMTKGPVKRIVNELREAS